MKRHSSFLTTLLFALFGLSYTSHPASAQSNPGKPTSQNSAGNTKAAPKLWQAESKWEKETEARLTQAQIDYGISSPRTLALMWQMVGLYQRAKLPSKALKTLRELRSLKKTRPVAGIPDDLQLARLESYLNSTTSKTGISSTRLNGEYFLILCSKVSFERQKTAFLKIGSKEEKIERARVTFTKYGKTKTFSILPSMVCSISTLPVSPNDSLEYGWLLEIMSDTKGGPLYCRSVREFLPTFEFEEMKRAKPSTLQVSAVELKTIVPGPYSTVAEFIAKVDRRAENDWKRMQAYETSQRGRMVNGRFVQTSVPQKLWWDTEATTISTPPPADASR